MDSKLRDIWLFSTGFVILMSLLIAYLFFEVPVNPTFVGAALSMMIGAPAIWRFLDKFDNNGGDK